ncbi:hypothetical protein [Aliiroseovarius crassostreae]|uniref:hypothetical protein n=1 Tax=Aliiroseovarius crassostreae TaxID=154981 RepID=UPI0022052238|nr:hypothetical protein [Aliiroseovarius crassostreae]UWQ04403.1 hypothetical protein K3X22_12085 [Aliiroseovarius crassostreae]
MALALSSFSVLNIPQRAFSRFNAAFFCEDTTAGGICTSFFVILTIWRKFLSPNDHRQGYCRRAA